MIVVVIVNAEQNRNSQTNLFTAWKCITACSVWCFVRLASTLNKWIKRVWFHLWLFAIQNFSSQISVFQITQFSFYHDMWHVLRNIFFLSNCVTHKIKLRDSWRAIDNRERNQNRLRHFIAPLEIRVSSWFKHANKLEKKIFWHVQMETPSMIRKEFSRLHQFKL